MENFKTYTTAELQDFDQTNQLNGPLAGYTDAADSYYFGQFDSFGKEDPALQGFEIETRIKDQSKSEDYNEYIYSQTQAPGFLTYSEDFASPQPVRKRAVPADILANHYVMLERQGYVSYLNPTNSQGAASTSTPFNDQDWATQYEFDQFSEFLHEDNDKKQKKATDKQHLYHMGMGGSLHINPAMIEGISHDDLHSQYDGESSQTTRKSRAAGKPTNIVPTSKMDRKTLKRLRNRVSASRCRIKKKVWINDMEERSGMLNDENDHLRIHIHRLEDAIAQSQRLLSFKVPLANEDSSQTLIEDLEDDKITIKDLIKGGLNLDQLTQSSLW